MPVIVKELHMAKNLTELKEISDIAKFKSKYKTMKADKIVEAAEKLYKRVMDGLKQEEKDDELLYMYLFRLMELWTLVFSTDDYKCHQKYYHDMHGKNVKNIFSLLEEYTNKLEKRYDELSKDGVKVDKNNLEASFQLVPIISVKKRRAKGDKEEILVNGVNNHHTPIDQDYLNNHDIIGKHQDGDSNNATDYYGEKKFMQCEELKNKLISFRDILVLDIRPNSDFECSKMRDVHCVNLPGKSIIPGWSANKLGGIITNQDEKNFWYQRGDYKQVVLLDWDSEEKDVIPGSQLYNLQTILLKWDPDVLYKNRPLILKGGYERWLDMYPMLTTNPHIKYSKNLKDNSFIHLSDHKIEYNMSELDEITSLKRKSLPHSAEIHSAKPPIPTVDRSTKPEKSMGKTDDIEQSSESKTEMALDRTISSHDEPMDEDKVPVKDFERPEPQSSPVSASKETPKVNTPDPYYSPVSSPPVRPTTPPRPEKSYPTTPKKTVDKGDGDGGIILEKLKSDKVSRSGGLKRSASSPNINKLANEGLDVTSSPLTPVFDRSTKPKPISSFNYDSYSPRNGGTDTIYQANNKAGRGLTGLKNLGNLCYMNSIMQCISNTVLLNKELTQFKKDSQEIGKRSQIVSDVSYLLRTLWTGDTRLTSCRVLKAKVGDLRKSFSTSEQQDSHEFLTLLIDWLHEDLNEPSLIKSLDGAVESTGEKAWGEFKKKNNSLVLDLFYGQLKSTVTCNHCQKQSILFEPFSNLSIPLPQPQEAPHDKDRKCTLQECLKLYLKDECISGWICPSCKTPREATKKLDITRLPPVLIIHLKRFMSDLGVGWCRKRMNMVEFPVNNFDMKPYTHRDSELRFHNYNLYAVSNHYGSMDSGHYTAYCKNYCLNKWYKFDDQDVNELSPNDIRSSAAYILFYESTQIERHVGLNESN